MSAPERVTPRKTLGYLLDRAPMTMREASVALGKKPSWATAMKSKTNGPRVSTVAAAASLSDLQLALVNPDKDVVAVIEPDGQDNETP